MSTHETVPIIGGGPAGTASAMNLLRHGFKPLIIEQDVFPRFHIGESLTTECVDALNRLGLREQLQSLSAPGKKGVRIFSRHPENSFYVGAGDAWQVERARFDSMMLNTAVERGALHLQGRARELAFDDGQWRLQVELPDGATRTFNSRFVIDASGQKRFSHRQGLFGPLQEGRYARQIAFFSQFEGVVRQPLDAWDTLIFHREMHEWCWMIPLSDSVTSIGLVLPVDSFKNGKLPADAFLDTRLAAFSDPLSGRLGSAVRVGPVRTVSNYSYKMEPYAARGLFCVGDSHRFIDPIFSFGVEFAVLEAEYAGKAIQACSRQDLSHWDSPARDYMNVTGSAQNVIEDLLNYFWAFPWGFANMAHMRFRDEFLEIFAGRIYETAEGEGLRRMRASLA
jgi:1H-pyrrole-2-carbonyl-[peptidyl-carrier protein] brominase